MSVENKLLLKRLAREINDLLSSYIEIHNLRLKEAGIFWSLFRKVDFSRIYKISRELLEKFEEEKDRLDQVGEDFYGESNSAEKEFFDALVEYFNALHETTQSLCALAEAQYLRSENRGSLSWEENKRLESAYQESVKKYYSLGERLNSLHAKLGERD